MVPPPILDDGDGGNFEFSYVVLMERTNYESQCTKGFLEHLVLLEGGGEGSQGHNPTKHRDR